MKLRHPTNQSGFTIVELLVAVSVAMVLILGALYSTAETFAVVRQGDARVNTQVHARRTLERLTKDCRYASDIAITGSASTSWTIGLTTGLDGDVWTWVWNANTNLVTVSDGIDTETVVEGVTTFEIDTATNSEGNISQVTLNWTLNEAPGLTAGIGQSNPAVSLASSTWVRRFAD